MPKTVVIVITVIFYLMSKTWEVFAQSTEPEAYDQYVTRFAVI